MSDDDNVLNDMDIPIGGANTEELSDSKKAWNPQPNLDQSNLNVDKQGNAFEHQAIICE